MSRHTAADLAWSEQEIAPTLAMTNRFCCDGICNERQGRGGCPTRQACQLPEEERSGWFQRAIEALRLFRKEA